MCNDGLFIWLWGELVEKNSAILNSDKKAARLYLLQSDCFCNVGCNIIYFSVWKCKA